MLRRISLYGGLGVLAIHVLKNRFQLQKRTAIYAAAPFVLEIAAQLIGYLYVDLTLSTKGLYDHYKIL